MSWLSELFTSRHVRWLEAEIEDLKRRHDIQIAVLKSAHTEELNRAITDADRLRGEVTRLRLYLIPPIAEDRQPESEQKSGTAALVFTGTPWQRVLAREVAAQDQDWNARHTKPAEEKTDGDVREGREPTPLSEPSQAA